MICKHCGTLNDNTAKFCENCNLPLPVDDSAPEAVKKEENKDSFDIQKVNQLDNKAAQQPGQTYGSPPPLAPNAGNATQQNYYQTGNPMYNQPQQQPQPQYQNSYTQQPPQQYQQFNQNHNQMPNNYQYIQNNYKKSAETVSVVEFLVLWALQLIPVLGFVFLIYNAFGSNIKPSMKNHCRALLILEILLIVFVIAILVFTFSFLDMDLSEFSQFGNEYYF